MYILSLFGTILQSPKWIQSRFEIVLDFLKQSFGETTYAPRGNFNLQNGPSEMGFHVLSKLAGCLVRVAMRFVC